ncbi:MAG: glycosyltransferase family 39 protein [Alphaproteobacteria bacterium]|nr:glycosyltransferase family 39 protein [Alphaproteobacteria bacterium]
MTSTQKFSHYLTAKPERLFWAFALTHLVLWTLVPSLACPNLPLDVVEGYAWGKEWLLGTHKHPPMQAWILETLYTLTGHGRWAPYLASQVAVVTAFWAVWQTGRRIAGETEGLIGAMLLEGVIYYNFTSPEFNPNVLQLPFWALAGWSFHKAVKDNKIADWFLLGLWAAAGMYTKYSTALFLMMLAASLFAHRDGRKRLTSVGPYLSVTIAILLFLPHLSWLINNHFLPMQYAMGRFERYPEHYTALITTSLMVAGQFLALIFMMLAMVALYDRRRAPSRKPAASFDRIFLSFAAFGPFAATFVLSLVFGYHIRDMWETPFWNFLGLWIVVFLRPSLQPQDLRRFALAWALVFATGLVLFLANEVLSPFVTTKPKRTIFPGKHLSHLLTDTWHDRFHTPLTYVVGDTWPAGNVAWYSGDRPHVYIDGNAEISPWIDAADLKRSGGIIVWCMRCGGQLVPNTLTPELQKEFPQAQIQEPLTLDRITYAQVPPAIVGWAIVPPQTNP